MNYKPFKNFEDFARETHVQFGQPIKLRFGCIKHAVQTYLIVSYSDNPVYPTVTIGARELTYEDLLKLYEFEKDGKWHRCGIEEKPKPEKFKPAHFQVGHTYGAKDLDNVTDQKCQIQARFRNAGTKNLQVVANNQLYDIYTDLKGNEYISDDGFGVVRYCADFECIPF